MAGGPVRSKKTLSGRERTSFAPPPFPARRDMTGDASFFLPTVGGRIAKRFALSTGEAARAPLTASQGGQGGFVQDTVAREESVTLDGARQSVTRLLAEEVRYPSACFLNQDLSCANVPIMKAVVGVEV